MRKLFLLLLAFLSVTNLAFQSGRRVSTPRTIPTAPVQPPLNPEPEVTSTPATPLEMGFLTERFREHEIKGINSGTFRLSDFQGKVIVINLWASWCGPCRREVPEYEKVRKVYAGRDVEFIGLTTEDPRTAADRVRSFLRDVSFGFRLGWADHDVAFALMDGKGAIPQTLVIDAKGRIVNHWTGYAAGRSAELLRQTIEAAFEER